MEQNFDKKYLRKDEIDRILEAKLSPMILMVQTLENAMGTYRDELDKIWAEFKLNDKKINDHATKIHFNYKKIDSIENVVS